MVKKKLIKIFSLIFKIKNKEKIQKLNTKNTSKWDSLLHIKLILCIEEEFKIKIINSNIPKLDSFQKINQFIFRLKHK